MARWPSAASRKAPPATSARRKCAPMNACARPSSKRSIAAPSPRPPTCACRRRRRTTTSPRRAARTSMARARSPACARRGPSARVPSRLRSSLLLEAVLERDAMAAHAHALRRQPVELRHELARGPVDDPAVHGVVAQVTRRRFASPTPDTATILLFLHQQEGHRVARGREGRIERLLGDRGGGRGQRAALERIDNIVGPGREGQRREDRSGYDEAEHPLLQYGRGSETRSMPYAHCRASL